MDNARSSAWKETDDEEEMGDEEHIDDTGRLTTQEEVDNTGGIRRRGKSIVW